MDFVQCNFDKLVCVGEWWALYCGKLSAPPGDTTIREPSAPSLTMEQRGMIMLRILTDSSSALLAVLGVPRNPRANCSGMLKSSLGHVRVMCLLLAFLLFSVSAYRSPLRCIFLPFKYYSSWHCASTCIFHCGSFRFSSTVTQTKHHVRSAILSSFVKQ